MKKIEFLSLAESQYAELAAKKLDNRELINRVKTDTAELQTLFKMSDPESIVPVPVLARVCAEIMLINDNLDRHNRRETPLDNFAAGPAAVPVPAKKPNKKADAPQVKKGRRSKALVKMERSQEPEPAARKPEASPAKAVIAAGDDGIMRDSNGYVLVEPCICLLPDVSGPVVVVDGNFRQLPAGRYMAANNCPYCSGKGMRPRRADNYSSDVPATPGFTPDSVKGAGG